MRITGWQKKRRFTVKKKHACLDARLVFASGIGTFLKAIIGQLEKQEALNVTLLYQKKDESWMNRNTRCAKILINSPIYSSREQAELPLKIPSCDLFWSPHFNIPLLPIRAKKRLVTIHDTYHLTFLSSLSLAQKAYAQLMYRGACLLSDSVTTISNFSKDEILQRCKVDPSKLKVIKLGTKDSAKPQLNNPLLHQKYHLPPEYLLVVTNYKPHKNFERIVKAARGICPLVVVGEKRKFEGGFATGFVEEKDLAYLYSHAKALVFPSLYEGFGLPPLEAMHSGCPVIVSKEASLPEVCEEAALYVNAYDENSIREGIKRILHDPGLRDTLIEKGFAVARKRPLEEAAKEYVKHVESLVA